MSTYTHSAHLFYIGYEKQLLSDRKPTGQHVLQLRSFVCGQ